MSACTSCSSPSTTAEVRVRESGSPFSAMYSYAAGQPPAVAPLVIALIKELLARLARPSRCCRTTNFYPARSQFLEQR
jgi:hypothetical protein